MLQLRITEILSHLNKAELKEFEKFVQSPFFSTGRNIYPLFKELKKYHPSFTNKELTEENLYSRAYGKKEFNNNVFRKLVSDLTTVAEEYIRFRFYSSSEPQRALALSNGYAIINDLDGMKKALQQAEKKLSSLKINHDYFEYMYELEQHYIHYNQNRTDAFTTHGSNAIKRSNNFVMNFLVRLPQQLHDFYVTGEGYYSGSETSIISEFIENVNLEGFLENLKANGDENYEIAALYGYNALLWTSKGNEDNFHKTLNLYKLCLDKLDKMDKYILGILMGTFCTKKEIEGNSGLIPVLVELYELMLKENILSGVYGKFIPGLIFADYVSRLVQLNRIEDAENFIMENSSKLLPEAGNRTRNLCNALIYTMKGENERSLKLLNETDTVEIKDKTSLKSLMAINYFELGYYENLLSLIDAAKKFISENKFMVSGRKEFTSAFFNALKKITLLKLNGTDEFTAKELKEMVANAPYITYRRWLLEKIEKLQQK